MFIKAFMPLRVFLCAMLLQACSPAALPTVQLAPTSSAEPAAAATVKASALPTLIATVQPTAGPTATVWPPTFTIWSFQDIRELDSFVVTINEKNTVNGQLTELTNTIGYIKEPYGAYDENKYYSGLDRTYTLDGWTYSLKGSGDWYISAGSTDDLF